MLYCGMWVGCIIGAWWWTLYKHIGHPLLFAAEPHVMPIHSTMTRLAPPGRTNTLHIAMCAFLFCFCFVFLLFLYWWWGGVRGWLVGVGWFVGVVDEAGVGGVGVCLVGRGLPSNKNWQRYIILIKYFSRSIVTCVHLAYQLMVILILASVKSFYRFWLVAVQCQAIERPQIIMQHWCFHCIDDYTTPIEATRRSCHAK